MTDIVNAAPTFKETLYDGDYWPHLIIGMTATLSSLWWICSWFIFIKNTPGDYILRSKTNQLVAPISFFWERVAETNGVYIYLAGSLMFTFFAYLIVSVIELIGWIFYLTGSPDFFGMWVSIIGYYGSIVLYVVPVLFAIMHIAITLNGTITATPGSYCVFLISIGTAMWLLNAFVHAYFSDRLVVEIARKNGGFKALKEAGCDLPRNGMSDNDYKVACEAILAAREDRLAASTSIEDASEEDSF